LDISSSQEDDTGRECSTHMGDAKLIQYFSCKTRREETTC